MPPADPFESMDDLNAYIAQLPAVAAGHRRVLRGQRSFHASLTPSGFRGTHPRSRLFKIASQLLMSDGVDLIRDDAADYFVATEIIAQHYGPGSPLLDVTTDLNVALWFALTQIEPLSFQMVVGAPGPFDATSDYVAGLTAMLPVSSGHAPGYLYVLDFPEVHGPRKLQHGELFDLGNATAEVGESVRIRNQHALVVGADSSESGGDLSSFQACAPLLVSPRLRKGMSQAVDLSLLFPPPSIDPWYERLLSVPLVLAKTDDDELQLTQAIPVTLWATDLEALNNLTETIIALDPPSMIPTLHAERTNFHGGFFAEDTVAILLEEPLFATTPRIESDQWRHRDAVSDLPLTAKTRSPTSELAGTIDLHKVYFEFSALEFGNWHAVEKPGAETTVQSGAYLERVGEEFHLWQVFRTLPTGGTRAAGPLTFVLSPQSGKLQVKLPDGMLLDARDNIPFALKTLLVTLTALRELSSVPIVNSYAAIETDDFLISPLVGGRELAIVTIRGVTTHLIREETKDNLPRRLLLEHGIQVATKSSIPPSTPLD